MPTPDELPTNAIAGLTAVTTATVTIDNTVYAFEAVQGVIQTTEEQLEAVQRPDADFYVLRETGRRAPPTQLRTITDFANSTAAIAALSAYQQLKAFGRGVIVKQRGTWYYPLNVLSVQGGVTPIATPAGSLVPDATRRLTCNWRLLAYDPPAP